uniref:Putative reverse transcriptase n=1 Tax=Panstrongylus lignarius TaxID=156445 RepID=A0A224Y468_9HEMI
MRHVSAIQRSVLLLMGSFSRTVSTEALQVLTGCLPLDLEIIQSAIKYFLRKGEVVSLGDITVEPFPDVDMGSG